MNDGIWTQVFRIEQQVLLSTKPSLPAPGLLNTFLTSGQVILDSQQDAIKFLGVSEGFVCVWVFSGVFATCDGISSRQTAVKHPE